MSFIGRYFEISAVLSSHLTNLLLQTNKKHVPISKFQIRKDHSSVFRKRTLLLQEEKAHRMQLARLITSSTTKANTHKTIHDLISLLQFIKTIWSTIEVKELRNCVNIENHFSREVKSLDREGRRTGHFLWLP